MSVEYCRECDKNIDTDFDEHYEHFKEYMGSGITGMFNAYKHILKGKLKGGKNDRKDN